MGRDVYLRYTPAIEAMVVVGVAAISSEFRRPFSRWILVGLAAIVDAVNAYDISGVKIEKHTPVADTETVEPVMAGKRFSIILAGFSIARERS